MSKVIDELKGKTLELKESISPISNIKLYGLYENAEYELYLSKVVELIDSQGFIDIYTLFLALNSELSLHLGDYEKTSQLLSDYNDYLKLSFNELSPANVNQRKTLSEKAGHSFLMFMESNLQEVYKAEDDDARLIDLVFLTKLEDFVSVFEELGLICDDSFKKNLLNTINKFKYLHDRKEKESLALQSQDEEATDTEKADKDKHSDTSMPLSNYKSYKWQTLLGKIEVLKSLVDKDRLFETAIVYEDIQQLLEDFDPKEYFPEVFFSLYKKVAPEVKKIQQSIDFYSTSAQWNIAKKMYQIDYESFLSDYEKMPENNVIGMPSANEHFYESQQEPVKRDSSSNSLFDVNFANMDNVSKDKGRAAQASADNKVGDETDDVFDF
ncbi:type VI secretion system protein IglI family protein [Francisella adeliensis]|uniref:Phage tail protein n=1 Tax=Francisella adeliensis TaxID=2007306 RepID=A0A2Z4XWJ9_9GAMM|nr:type VI secretion system protein IglI family protein [Francisella adeliensis]AXA32998.1 hypothetical protein CDH04_00575 [Francisella adeliensis]MBK2086116.1 phage tail protein [Francisella adeliensis]MBK2096720.1 phage tail protein [Francisella adeliensis]QIW11225.1 phage tail protein [Francisella adeliensis]QIW13101.1 phage tail protein [Francisella adeliensis]